MEGNQHTPALSTGWKGLKENWQHDLVAGLSVALVALPLSLGIAIASGAPPVAGLLSAVIGGVVGSILSGGHISIKGPANSLIVITASAIVMFRAEGIENVFGTIMAAFAVAGGIQMVMGILRMGRLGDLFPSSVINGLLAAIGIMIVAKQAHVALGQPIPGGPIADVITSIPQSAANLNPYIAIISAICLAIMVFHPYIKSKLIHTIPAPLWVLFIAIPVFFGINYINLSSFSFSENLGRLDESLLVTLPSDIFGSLVQPDFTHIATPVFWKAVIMITVVTTIETLVSAKAVDKLDPYKRGTNLNKDLAGVGLATVASAFAGGLPVTAVIARSSVNANHGARTLWSNVFHGLIILFLLLVLTPVIQLVPSAALAAILVFTGYKLTSPRVYIDAYLKGLEQFFIVVVTLLSTILMNDLIWGLAIGIAFTLFVQLLKSNIPPTIFLRYLIKPNINITADKESDYLIRIKGVSSFFNIVSLINKLNQIPKGKEVVVDFSQAVLIDYTVLEHVHEYEDDYNREGGTMSIIGLSAHQTSSTHPNALHILYNRKYQTYRLTKRQQKLKTTAAHNNWQFQAAVNWNTSLISDFPFFDSRPVEYKNNMIIGTYEELAINWEVSDITFDEGALVAEVYQTTVQVVGLPFTIPQFTLQKESFVDRIVDFASQEDIDFVRFEDFSRKFLLRGRDEQRIRDFFDQPLLTFLEEGEVYHLESTGNAICIFKYTRLATQMR